MKFSILHLYYFNIKYKPEYPLFVAGKGKGTYNNPNYFGMSEKSTLPTLTVFYTQFKSRIDTVQYLIDNEIIAQNKPCS